MASCNSCSTPPVLALIAAAVLVVTAHKSVDYDLVAAHAQLIVDARGRFPLSDKVVRA